MFIVVSLHSDATLRNEKSITLTFTLTRVWQNKVHKQEKKKIHDQRASQVYFFPGVYYSYNLKGLHITHITKYNTWKWHISPLSHTENKTKLPFTLTHIMMILPFLSAVSKRVKCQSQKQISNDSKMVNVNHSNQFICTF